MGTSHPFDVKYFMLVRLVEDTDAEVEVSLAEESALRASSAAGRWVWVPDMRD